MSSSIFFSVALEVSPSSCFLNNASISADSLSYSLRYSTGSTIPFLSFDLFSPISSVISPMADVIL